jgi:hypothetical protein
MPDDPDEVPEIAVPVRVPHWNENFADELLLKMEVVNWNPMINVTLSGSGSVVTVMTEFNILKNDLCTVFSAMNNRVKWLEDQLQVLLKERAEYLNALRHPEPPL